MAELCYNALTNISDFDMRGFKYLCIGNNEVKSDNSLRRISTVVNNTFLHRRSSHNIRNVLGAFSLEEISVYYDALDSTCGGCNFINSGEYITDEDYESLTIPTLSSISRHKNEYDYV